MSSLRNVPTTFVENNENLVFSIPTSNSFTHLGDELSPLDPPQEDVSHDKNFEGVSPTYTTQPRQSSSKTRDTAMRMNSDSHDYFPIDMSNPVLPSDGHAQPLKKPQPTRPVALLIGDSIPRYLIGRRLSRRYRVLNYCIPGMTLQKLCDFVPLLVHAEDPAVIIVHCGTNNIATHNTSGIINLLSKLDSTLKSLVSGVKVAFSGLTGNGICPHTDIQICHINDAIRQFCEEHNSVFICNSNITLSHISRDGIHLNRRGIVKLAMNFISYLRSTMYSKDDSQNFQQGYSNLPMRTHLC
ncbi:hypothetical protein HOLleu_43514 [Holothuria leucospilota]|uniref:SGNH hydrolase-type esterase domain-containing protein n=1 Tax=Holothuria leucospilota TaxID=206669 RepID=A0A9Q0YBT9_HOLLE|nr:hypothetical protein HOLleu_43514 [Holothuria leucospilota]